MLPSAYGCVVENRFGQLLDDDADPFDLINEAIVEKEKNKKKDEQKKVKVKPKTQTGQQRETQKDRRAPCVTDGSGEDGQARHDAGRKRSTRGGVTHNDSRGVVEADRGARRAVLGERRTNEEERPLEYSIQQPAYYAYSDSRGGRGGRGGRGAYFRNMDAGSGNPRGKREYERYSGNDRTGISPEEKRGGRGPWNWESVQDSMGDGMDITTNAGGVRSEEAQQPVELEGENQASQVEGEVVVQVAMEMSLDEWKALQERSRPKAELKLRKADSNVPSKATVIHMSKCIESPKEESLEEEDYSHFLRRSLNDITSRLDINFGSLQRPSRGGRGRGGRGGQSSRPEREAETRQPEKADVHAPNPDDPEDFPALAVGR